MHWPYATSLMLIGSVLLATLYIIRFLLKPLKVLLDYVKLGLIVFWVSGYLLKAFHLISFSYVFEIITFGLFIWWFIQEGIYVFTKRKLKDNLALKFVYYTLISITSALLLFGILFKIQHWPYGSLMFTLGIFLLTMMLIIDYFAIKKPMD